MKPICGRAMNGGLRHRSIGYEAWADLSGERVKLQVFSMRSMASAGAFHRAHLRATQQAFLEAHELAFEYFGRFPSAAS